MYMRCYNPDIDLCWLMRDMWIVDIVGNIWCCKWLECRFEVECILSLGWCILLRMMICIGFEKRRMDTHNWDNVSHFYTWDNCSRMVNMIHLTRMSCSDNLSSRYHCKGTMEICIVCIKLSSYLSQLYIACSLLDIACMRSKYLMPQIRQDISPNTCLGRGTCYWSTVCM